LIRVRLTSGGERRYDVRLRDPSGRVYTKTFRTRREADLFEATERASRARGTWLDPSRAEQKLRDAARDWLDSNPAKRPSSVARDESALRVHILPAIGDRAIGALTPSDIQRCVNEWSRSLAPRSVRRIYQTLAAILNASVLDDRIGRSPCRGIRLPAIDPVDRAVLSSEELAALSEALGPRYGTMVYLGAVLGLRWGECAGLRVGRIDFEECTIRIVEQITRGSAGRSALGRPKSEASRRTLAVPPALMTMVEDHLGRLDLTRADGQAFVFPSHDSEHLDYSNWLHRIWYPARAKAELDWVQFHDLRRANATGLVVEGVDIKTAQKRLGHTDPRLTLSVYAQAIDGADRAAAAKLGRRFLQTSEGDLGLDL
jgi:integrase